MLHSPFLPLCQLTRRRREASAGPLDLSGEFGASKEELLRKAADEDRREARIQKLEREAADDAVRAQKKEASARKLWKDHATCVREIQKCTADVRLYSAEAQRDEHEEAALWRNEQDKRATAEKLLQENPGVAAKLAQEARGAEERGLLSVVALEEQRRLIANDLFRQAQEAMM